MANYDKNFLTMMGGHLNVYGDNGEVKIGTGRLQEKTPIDNTADVRDILTNIVGKGYKGLTDNGIKGDYARLANLVGLSKAQKLVDTALVYNQRSDVIGKPLEQRVQGFYNMGSQDKDLNGIITSAAKLGDGPVAGMLRSKDRTNMDLVGTDIIQTPSVAANQEILKVAKNKLK